MKWILGTAFVVVAAAAGVTAQSGQDMTMATTMKASYTGCVEAANDGHSFLLTHVEEGHSMSDHMAMADGKSPMKKKDDPAGAHEMSGHEMKPDGLVLAGRPDLKMHAGKKVAVTGAVSHDKSEMMSADRDTLTVASLKVLAKSCS